MHWIAGTPPAAGQRLRAMTRYRMVPAACDMERASEDRWRVRFDAPQWAPTPGQYLVVYDGNVCLGGGVIESSNVSRRGWNRSRRRWSDFRIRHAVGMT